jgi:hypothetical protein
VPIRENVHTPLISISDGDDVLRSETTGSRSPSEQAFQRAETIYLHREESEDHRTKQQERGVRGIDESVKQDEPDNGLIRRTLDAQRKKILFRSLNDRSISLESWSSWKPLYISVAFTTFYSISKP